MIYQLTTICETSIETIANTSIADEIPKPVIIINIIFVFTQLP